MSRAGAPFIVVLLVGLLIRAVLVAGPSDYVLFGDAADYVRHSKSISGSLEYPHSIDGPDGGSTAFRPPLYPLYLGAVRFVVPDAQAVNAARLGQALLGMVAPALIALICLRLWGRRVALAAFTVAALYPPWIVLNAAVLSETLFLVFELGAVAALVEARTSARALRWIAAAGVLIGLAALTRTVGAALLVPALVAVVLAARGRGRRSALVPAAVLVLAAVVTVAPWTVRNAATLDAFVPVSTEGGHTLAGAYNETVGAYPLDERLWQPPWSAPDLAHLYWRPGYAERAVAAAKPPGRLPREWRTDLPEPELEHELRGEALDYMGDRPGYVARKVAFNTATLFAMRGPGNMRPSFEEKAVRPAWLMDAGTWAFYVVVALAVFAVAAGHARGAPAWLWIVPLVFVPAVAIDSLTRFRAPVDAVLLMLAGVGLAALTRRRAPR